MTETLFTRRAIIVVEAADQAAANRDAQVADPTTDLHTFRACALSADGTGAPTHYACCWWVTQAQYDALVGLFDGKGTRRLWDSEVTPLEEVLAGIKLARIVPIDAETAAEMAAAAAVAGLA